MHTGFSKKIFKNFHRFFKKIELSKVKAIFLARLIKSLTKHPNFSTFSRFCNIAWVMPATFLLYPWHNVESRPVPFIPRDGTGRDGIGTGFSKWDGIVPTLPIVLHFTLWFICKISGNSRKRSTFVNLRHIKTIAHFLHDCYSPPFFIEAPRSCIRGSVKPFVTACTRVCV